MIHIIITLSSAPPTLSYHQFQGKTTTGTERQLANVLNVYLCAWLRKKATEFGHRFRIIP
jgi:hypothetical protein